VQRLASGDIASVNFEILVHVQHSPTRIGLASTITLRPCPLEPVPKFQPFFIWHWSEQRSHRGEVSLIIRECVVACLARRDGGTLQLWVCGGWIEAGWNHVVSRDGRHRAAIRTRFELHTHEVTSM
jgi:hypothetical protein